MMVMLEQVAYVKDGLPRLIYVLEERMNWEKHVMDMVNFRSCCISKI